jgi:hypothetical protein
VCLHKIWLDDPLIRLSDSIGGVDRMEPIGLQHMDAFALGLLAPPARSIKLAPEAYLQTENVGPHFLEELETQLEHAKQKVLRSFTSCTQLYCLWHVCLRYVCHVCLYRWGICIRLLYIKHCNSTSIMLVWPSITHIYACISSIPIHAQHACKYSCERASESLRCLLD